MIFSSLGISESDKKERIFLLLFFFVNLTLYLFPLNLPFTFLIDESISVDQSAKVVTVTVPSAQSTIYLLPYQRRNLTNLCCLLGPYYEDSSLL